MKNIDKISQYAELKQITLSKLEKLFQLGNSTLSRIIAENREISEHTLRKMRKGNSDLYAIIFGEWGVESPTAAPIDVPDKYIGQLEKNIDVLEKQVTLLEGQVSSLQVQIRNNSLLAASLATTNQGVLVEILCHLKKLKIGEVEQRLGRENFDNLERLKKVVGN